MPDDTNGGSSMSDERLEILRLVENQTITAEEASRLLEALDRSDRQQQETQPFDFPFAKGFPFGSGPRPSKPGRNIRIRITDTTTQEARLNLVLPRGLLDAGLKMAKRIAPDHILDAKDIRDSVDDGFEGALLDVSDDNQRVEILIEPRQ